MKAEDIFLAALVKPSPGQRAAYLDEMCGADFALRAEVVALLRSHERAGSFLQGSLFDPGATNDVSATPELTGSRIGPYKLLQLLGEGGMGTVWLAEQTAPVKRLVALKVIKAGMDSRQVLARFGAERQALALMDHPNIAKVLDAGATEQGRPYFVMELVKGVPMTRFCDERRLAPKERLELFIPVCLAVQHAHQKGIIHRDLKPSNVVVGLYDGKPVPKIIDFGVAKATGAKLTEATLFTAFGQVVGTPEYMSPEQAQLDNIDIDTRADIYSLGVLLYELLTGTTPLQHKRVQEAAVLEVLRLIREEEPPKPSSRLSTTEHLPSIAADRNLEPTKLTGLVHGELDWIVMKCLEKDRNRRYETANGLAQDLQHYLADEPVSAGPPSAWYRFRKLARRNKGALAAALAGILAVLAVLIGLAVNNWLVTREEQKTVAALTRVVHEKDRADQNLAEARRAVKDYLLKTSDSPLLKSADFQNLRKELLESALPFYQGFVQQAREDAGLEVERGRAHQDLAALRRELGDRPRGLDELAQAESIFQLLAKNNPEEPEYSHELAGTLITRGVLLDELARFDEAEQAFRQALAILEPLAAKNPRREYRAMLAQATSNLGDLLRELGRGDEADATLRRAITLRGKLLEEQPDSLEFRGQLAQSWVNLGAVSKALRRPDDAIRAFEEAAELLSAETARKAPSTSALFLKFQQIRAQALNNLGIIHREAGRLVQAEKSAREALAIKESLQETFPSVPQYRQELARSFNNLGALLASLNRQEDARVAYEKAVATYERLVAGANPLPVYSVEMAGTYGNLGRLIGDQGRLEESLPSLTKSIDLLKDAYRKDSREVKVRESLLVARSARAMTLAGLGRYRPAADDWSRAIELDDGRYHSSLRLKRASTLLNLKDHAGATADAQAIAESKESTVGDLYNAACVYALSTGMAAGDASVTELYAASAVKLLRRAVARGYKDAAHLKKDTDLDALRAREDFKKLLQELEERP